MVRRSGPNARSGQRGPVFKEINWLQRWPKLVSTGFILLILLEIIVFVWVADRIGLGLTLLAVVGSAFIGLWLIRRTGLDMVAKLRLTLAQGQEPGHSLVDGACFVVAGLLLILPGFFSDLMAIVLMLPMSRNWLIRRFSSKIAPGFGGGARATTTVITDVDFREVQTADEDNPSAPAAGIPDAVVFEAETAEIPADEAKPTQAEPEIWVPQRRAEDSDRVEDAPGPGESDTSVSVSGDDDQAGTDPEKHPKPAGPTTEEDERWGRAPRRPIIDVEES